MSCFVGLNFESSLSPKIPLPEEFWLFMFQAFVSTTLQSMVLSLRRKCEDTPPPEACSTKCVFFKHINKIRKQLQGPDRSTARLNEQPLSWYKFFISWWSQLKPTVSSFNCRSDMRSLIQASYKLHYMLILCHDLQSVPPVKSWKYFFQYYIKPRGWYGFFVQCVMIHFTSLWIYTSAVLTAWKVCLLNWHFPQHLMFQKKTMYLLWPHTVLEKKRISYCNAIFDIFLRL